MQIARFVLPNRHLLGCDIEIFLIIQQDSEKCIPLNLSCLKGVNSMIDESHVAGTNHGSWYMFLLILSLSLSGVNYFQNA